MKKIAFFSLLLATSCAAFAQNGPTPFPANPADWPGKGPVRTFGYMNDNRAGFWARRSQDQGGVVLVGDSLVAGAKKWEALQQAFPNLVLANRGIGGDTSRGVLFRFQEDVLDLHPKAIMMIAGSNDLSAYGKTEDTISNLTEMVAMAKKQDPNTRVIVCTIPPRNNPKAPTQPGKLEELNQKIRDLPPQDGVAVLDIYPLFLKEDGTQDTQYFGEDKLHFNEAGYVKLNEAVKKEFEALKIQ